VAVKIGSYKDWENLVKSICSVAIACFVAVFVAGCGQGGSSGYSPDEYSSGTGSSVSDGYIDYESQEFQNASEEVQQDAIIFNSLRDMGYTEEEARDAVLNTIE